MSISMRGRMPGGDRNGLAQHETHSREHPDQDVVIVARLSLREIKEKLDKEDDPWELVFGVSQIETVSADERGFVESIMNGAYERRTGKQGLPFGQVAE